MSLPAFDDSATAGLPGPGSQLDLVPQRDRVLSPLPANVDAARLDIVPRSNLQPRDKPRPLVTARGVAASVVIHAGFAALFVLLLNWRELTLAREEAIPIEIVSRMPGGANVAAGNGAQPTGAQTQPESSAPPTPNSPEKQASATPPPHLVAPPPEAERAATQAQENKPANLAPDPPKPDRPPPAQPAAAPDVLASAAGESTVAKVAPARPEPLPAPKPAPAEPKPNPAAPLMATLPMDMTSMPMSFRAVLSGAGANNGEEYKGLVFGKLGRSRSSAERARSLHLRGHVMVSFTLDDSGGIGDLRVAQSSGTAAVDAAALDMVREAAPFPPPPPGGQRSFSPVLSFGAE